MHTPTHAIAASELFFDFPDRPVLRGVKLQVPWGQLCAIAGPNGAGKSSLLEILAGARRPSSGTVHRAGEVALVVQRVSAPAALPLTVREVVQLGVVTRGRPGARRAARADRAARALDALARVGLTRLAERPFAALSGGQRQRVLLAQAVARAAPILMLDEPAAGLDIDSRGRMLEILAEEAARGAAVICVSHDPELIASAQQLLTLREGRLV